MTSLGAIMAALQTLATAVSHDDLDAYRAALVAARNAGCSEEQIKDAWAYRGRQRLRTTVLRPVSFDWEGNPR